MALDQEVRNLRYGSASFYAPFVALHNVGGWNQ